MLRTRFHPAAEEKLIAAGQHIKEDDPKEAYFFQEAFAEALDWAGSEPLIFRCFEKDFR